MPLPRPVSSADMRTAGSLPASPAPPGRRATTASSSNAQLGLKLAVERGAYVAGQQVKGVLELSVKGHLALGEIGIEFLGVEELRSRDHTSTRRLLSDRVDFQGNGLPPSNAVKPGTKPIQASYYPALPGRTRFAFAFTIPASLPSTCALGSNAQTRYELRAFASSLVDGSVDLRSEKLDVRVVERWGDWREDAWQKGLERKAQGTLALGGDGNLELVASVGQGEWAERPARLFWRSDGDMDVAGKGKIEVRARVRNLSKRHVTGLKLSLIRRLRVLYPEDARPLVEPPVVSSVVLTERFHGIDYDVRSGGERDAVLAMQVPSDECWTVRKGTLFELDVVLRVEVECGFLQKSLAVDLPIWIAHPLSLPNSAHRFADEERARLAPVVAPVSVSTLAPTPSPQPSIPYSPSTVGTFSAPAPYHALSPEPYAPAFAHGAQLPLPGTPAPGQHGRHYAASAISMSSSVSSPAMYPPPTPAPYFPPPPAAPAELYDPVPAAYAAPHGYVAFDPSVPDLSTSHFLGSLQHQQPGFVPTPPGTAFSPPPQAQVLPRSPYGVQPQLHQNPPPHGPPRPPSRAHTIASGLDLPPHEAAQVEANLGPLEPYSGMQRAHQHARTASDLPYLAQRSVEPVRQHSAPAAAPPVHASELDLPSASPPRPCASPIPSNRGEVSSPAPITPPIPVTSPTPSRTRISHTPPPPSPSSHFRRGEQSSSPSPSPSPVDSAPASSTGVGPPAPPTLLETIGEDGESQAGNTARSAMLPAGMADALKDDAAATGSSRGRSSVQDLEELVEEEERREVERKERNRVEGEVKREGDVPPMSFPTSAASSRRDARPRAQDIFAPAVATSDTSASAAVIPSSASSSSPTRLAAPTRTGGGLSALEARLARPSTPDLSALQLSSPSRSPSPIKPLGSPAPRTRAFAPHLDLLLAGESETVGSALRARSISRASRYEEERRKADEVDPKEAVRKAVASAEWAKGPSARPAEAPAHVGSLAPCATSSTTVAVADWVKSVEPVAPTSVERSVRSVDEQVVADDGAAKVARPAQYKPLAPLKLAAPTAEPAMQAPSSPSSPRRPLPSPPPSPRRALPSPPMQTGPHSKSASPPHGPAAVAELPTSPARPVARPVFGLSPSKRDVSPPPPVDKASSSSLPIAPRSPIKSSPSPWSSKPSPWSSVGRSPSPVKIASPAPAPSSSFNAPKSPVAAVVDDGGRKVVDVAEIKGLKREAVDRVAGWLKDADADGPAAPPAPDSVVSLQTKQHRRITIEFGRHAPEPPSTSSPSSKTPLSRSIAGSPSFPAARRVQQQSNEPTVAQLLAAETRAAMRQAQADAPAELTRSSAVEKGLNGYLAALKSDAEDSGKDEQAHRSARRAAPGKVRSVASIWAERVEEADRDRTDSPPPSGSPHGHKPSKSLSSIQLGSLASSTSSPRPLSSLGNSSLATAAPPSSSARRARPVSLQPSASPARPFLNSTVGRASPSSTSAATATTNMRGPSIAASATKATGKLAASESAPAGWASSPARASAADRSGGAKVKDLLARYQQQLA